MNEEALLHAAEVIASTPMGVEWAHRMNEAAAFDRKLESLIQRGLPLSTARGLRLAGSVALLDDAEALLP